jgi:hypothetical protein
VLPQTTPAPFAVTIVENASAWHAASKPGPRSELERLAPVGDAARTRRCAFAVAPRRVISSAHSVRHLWLVVPTLPSTRPTQAQHFVADTEPQ